MTPPPSCNPCNKNCVEPMQPQVARPELVNEGISHWGLTPHELKHPGPGIQELLVAFLTPILCSLQFQAWLEVPCTRTESAFSVLRAVRSFPSVVSSETSPHATAYTRGQEHQLMALP